MKQYSIVNLFFVCLVIIFFANIIGAKATRPSSYSQASQPFNVFITKSTNDLSRNASLAVGMTNAPTSGVVLDINGTLFTKGLVVPANTQNNYNFDTTNMTVSKLSGSSNRELCVNSSGKFIVCP